MNLSSLNDKQREAVEALLGPVLVLAGAGSGKTRVLTYRIAYLIEQGLMKGDHILALTFTNKAAKEMQERVLKLLGSVHNVSDGLAAGSAALGQTQEPFALVGKTGLPTLGTFHSVCARLLRREITQLGYSRDFSIYDADDQLKVLREICRELELPKRFGPTLFRAYISRAKNVVQTPEQLNIGLDPIMQEMVFKVYAAYQNYLFRQNALDFDDLLMLLINIFQFNAQTLRKYQDQFQYILVDEYQDTNPAQYLLLSLLAQRRNLFVVGDDAQSIYGFRGSTITNILNFEKDFPEARVIKLEQNYRSTKNILAVADAVITLNPEQKPKTLWTQNDAGAKIWIEQTEDERAEARFVVSKIVRLAAGQGDEPEYEMDEEAEVDFRVEPDGSAGPLGPSIKSPAKSISILDRFIQSKRRQLDQRQLNDPLSPRQLPASSRVGRLAASNVSASEMLAQRVNPAFNVPQLPKDHAPLNQFAVLYRTHAQSRALEEAFIAASIPYQIVGGVKFYERREIKDMLAYLRLVLNFRDLVSLKRVLNVPARGIGDKAYQTIKQFVLAFGQVTSGTAHRPRRPPEADFLRMVPRPDVYLSKFRQQLESIALPGKQFQSVQQFFWLIEDFAQFDSSEPVLSLMRYVFKKSGLKDWLDDGTEEGNVRTDNVKELFNVAAKYDNLAWGEGLRTFLEEVALVTEIDTLQDAKDAVTLMTLHSAKGLEFDTVFFVGLEEGILPHSRSLLEPAELSEEIRLAYVGLTRARQRLFLIYARSRTQFGNVNVNSPSRILRVLRRQHIAGPGASVMLADDGEMRYEAADF